MKQAATSKPTRTTAVSRVKNCAECRRLKIKCCRNTPCENCVKSGKASICPDGALAPKGHRLILSNTEELHNKIDNLTARIRELEDALETLQTLHYEEPHPLLDGANEPPTAAFGSLKIHGDGVARFYGGTSTIEWLMTGDEAEPKVMAQHIKVLNDGSTTDPNDGTTLFPHSRMKHPLQTVSDLAQITADGPLFLDEESIDIAHVSPLIISELPDKGTALQLVDRYYERTGWELCPILRRRLMKDFIEPCYEAELGSTPKSISFHRLALLYALFAIAMLHSPEHPRYAYLSARYMTLSRTCLTIDSPISNTTSTSIDILLLHVAYLFACDEPHAYVRGEATIGVCMKLAHSIGLHRDPSLWGLPAEESARRRRTMWELICIDLWAALSSGRPPLTLRRYIDVKLPLDPLEDGDPTPNYTLGKHYFSEACLWQVLELGLAPANTSTYSTVMKLDQKVRKYTLPPGLMVAEQMKPNVCVDEVDGGATEAAESFRKATVSIFKEIALLCLHRSYFASALLLPPFQPLSSPYAPSFVSAFASACAILTSIRNLYAREPILIMRFAWFWTYGFTCAVINGSLVARAPDCELAERALNEFDLILDVFRRAQANPRAGRGLPTLVQLNRRAHEAMDAYNSGTWSPPTTTDPKLYYGLGAAGSVLQSQAARDGTIPPAGVNTFLPPTPSQGPAHEPLRATGDESTSHKGAYQVPSATWSKDNPASKSSTILKSSISNEPFDSSDQFLQSMVVDSFFPSIPDLSESSTTQYLKVPEGFMQPGSQGPGAFDSGFAQPFTVPPFDPTQDVDFASFMTRDPSYSTTDPTMSGNLAGEDSLSLWDNLLREFGVASPAHMSSSRPNKFFLRPGDDSQVTLRSSSTV